MIGQVAVAHVFNSVFGRQRQADLLRSRQPGLQELVPGQAPKLQRNLVLKKQNNNNKAQ